MRNRTGGIRVTPLDDNELKAEIDAIASRIDFIIETVKAFFPTAESASDPDAQPNMKTHLNVLYNQKPEQEA